MDLCFRKTTGYGVLGGLEGRVLDMVRCTAIAQAKKQNEVEVGLRKWI